MIAIATLLLFVTFAKRDYQIDADSAQSGVWMSRVYRHKAVNRI